MTRRTTPVEDQLAEIERADGIARALARASSGGGAWGSITGTLSEQADLQTALNNKAASTHDHDGVYAPAGASGLTQPQVMARGLGC